MSEVNNMGSRYSIKKQILITIIATTMGAMISVVMVILIGFGFQGTIIYIFLLIPFILFVSLYGFYKALVKYHGFKGDENLFFGGRF